VTYLLARVFFTASLTFSMLVLVFVGEASHAYLVVALAIWGVLSLLLWLGFMAMWLTRETHAETSVPVLLSTRDLRDSPEQAQGSKRG